MEVKIRGQKLFPLLCGLLVVIACCFRTTAILQEDKSWVSPPELPTYVYMTREQSEMPVRVTEEQGAAELSMPRIDNRSGADFDGEALLRKELHFPVTEEPCVLIIHTHGSEAYRDQEGYRCEDPEQNVIRVGREIADSLNAAGIPTIHDTTAHDLTDGYDRAYEQTEEAIEAYLDKYPTIRMVIDVHRDAASDGQGGQKPISCNLHGEEVAGLMLVMGTDTAELPHENWRENLAFAMQLQAYLTEDASELMRPISLRSARYNEHFTPCSILLEVGSAGNTMEEALLSGRYFGEGLAGFIKAMEP